MRKINCLFAFSFLLACVISSAEQLPVVKIVSSKISNNITQIKYVVVRAELSYTPKHIMRDFSSKQILIENHDGTRFTYNFENGTSASLSPTNAHCNTVPRMFSNGFLVGNIERNGMDVSPCCWELKNDKWLPFIPNELKEIEGAICFVSKDKKIFAGNQFKLLNDGNTCIQAFIYNAETKKKIMPGTSAALSEGSKFCAASKNGTLFSGKFWGHPALFQYKQGEEEKTIFGLDNGHVAGMNTDASVLFGKTNKTPCFWIKSGKKYLCQTLESLIKQRGLKEIQNKSLRIVHVSDDRKTVVLGRDSCFSPSTKGLGNDTTLLAGEEKHYYIVLNKPL